MAHKKRRIVHKTLKKRLAGVPDDEQPFLEWAWNEDSENEEGGQGRTFEVYLAEMNEKYPGGIDDSTPEEDSPREKDRKEIRALLQTIPDVPTRKLFIKLFKRLNALDEDD